MKKTVRGIHLDINPAVFDDVLTVEMMSDIMTPLPEGISHDERAAAESERIKAILAYSRRILGKDFDRVYKQMAKRSGGYLSFEAWTEFINQVAGEYQEKNPDARPAPGGKQGRARS